MASNSCVLTIQICKAKFGVNAIDVTNERSCTCAQGYGWDASDSFCEKKYTATDAYNYARDLQMGSSGEDVIYLQTFLESQGVLIMSAGLKKGYFGDLTKKALKKYQTQMGLPSTGTFDGNTRLLFNS